MSETGYDGRLDKKRLAKQHEEVLAEMLKASLYGKWLTLGEIHYLTGNPEASISARLRELRTSRFGSYIVEKRRRGQPIKGLYEYSLRKPVLDQRDTDMFELVAQERA